MLDALITSIPHPRDKKIKAIDLGCGTGTIAKMVKEAFPSADIHCVDIAPNMLEVAKRKLAGWSDITFEEADLSSYNFHVSYDAAVSSLALHHLPSDQDKIDFYAKVHEALNPGGVFLNADNIISSNETLQQNDMDHWKLFMRKNLPEDQIPVWLAKHEEEDHPAKLIEQLAWLQDIGFIDIDVIWKYFNFAVFGGFKR
jgi:tRNA (cmo5U34)-methyltransferase